MALTSKDDESKEEETKGIPPSFVCPLTREVMRDPVVLPNGISYERSAVAREYAIEVMFPNRALKSMIDASITFPSDRHNQEGSWFDCWKVWASPNDNNDGDDNDPYPYQYSPPAHFPDEWFCPITSDLLRTPVVDPDGFSYEKTSILEWLRQNGSSPITREARSERDLVSNRNLRRWVETELGRPPPDQLPMVREYLSEERRFRRRYRYRRYCGCRNRCVALRTFAFQQPHIMHFLIFGTGFLIIVVAILVGWSQDLYDFETVQQTSSRKPNNNDSPCPTPERIGDGVCDRPVYFASNCQEDGGDCQGCVTLLQGTWSGNTNPDESDYYTLWALGDGVCDGGLYNTPECAYDGGDCLEFNRKYPNCDVPHPSLIQNGFCDAEEDGYRTPECAYDGGDCLQL